MKEIDLSHWTTYEDENWNVKLIWRDGFNCPKCGEGLENCSVIFKRITAQYCGNCGCVYVDWHKAI